VPLSTFPYCGGPAFAGGFRGLVGQPVGHEPAPSALLAPDATYTARANSRSRYSGDTHYDASAPAAIVRATAARKVRIWVVAGITTFAPRMEGGALEATFGANSPVNASCVHTPQMTETKNTTHATRSRVRGSPLTPPRKLCENVIVRAMIPVESTTSCFELSTAALTAALIRSSKGEVVTGEGPATVSRLGREGRNVEVRRATPLRSRRATLDDGCLARSR